MKRLRCQAIPALLLAWSLTLAGCAVDTGVPPERPVAYVALCGDTDWHQPCLGLADGGWWYEPGHVPVALCASADGAGRRWPCAWVPGVQVAGTVADSGAYVYGLPQ